VRDAAIVPLLRSVPVNVTIATGDSAFPIRSLVSLQVGDTLVLDQKCDIPVVIKVAGKSKLYAKVRMDTPNKVFVVAGCVRPSKEESLNGRIAQ
jgi:flagellar motor switch protein FliM